MRNTRSLMAFVKLDFLTVKPYFTAKHLLVFAAVVIFLSAVNGSAQLSLGIGFMLGTLFVGYPFAIGEKTNLDALYVTLSVRHQDVVLGRYIFTLLLDVFAIVFSFLIAHVGIFGARLLHLFQNAKSVDAFVLVLVMSGVLILIQVVQLPFFFKVGYTKGKILALIPYVLFMSSYIVFANLAEDSGKMAKLAEMLAPLQNNGMWLAALAGAFLLLVVFISFRLSVLFYGKRSF